MTINKAFISGQDISQNFDTVVEMLAEPPITSEENNPPLAPNKLCGYYNATLDGVQLYITDSSGRFFLRVR